MRPVENEPQSGHNKPLPRMPSRYPRRREVAIGSVVIGGDNPVTIQSMTNTATTDVDATVAQIRCMTELGCDLARVSVPNERSAQAFGTIKKNVDIPLIADIHFNPALALAVIEAGADKVRLNPGNISTRERIAPVAKELARRRIPVRVGVNAGSITHDLRQLFSQDPSKAIVESAHRHVGILQNFGVEDIVVSLKSSEVPDTLECYRRFAGESDLPLHIGITEAGPGLTGATRSGVGIGLLLAEGLGDTVRASLAGPVEDEIIICREILASLNLREAPRLVACPTCARAEFDVVSLAGEIHRRVMALREPITVAVMGCVVNGPGEAEHADLGIISANGKFMLYREGKVIAKGLAQKDAVNALNVELDSLEPKL
jgi:(E)-4-hydroxy-3-methylbut-2-enyl-diphosphate synthase